MHKLLILPQRFPHCIFYKCRMNWILDYHVAFVKYVLNLSLKNFLSLLWPKVWLTGLSELLTLWHDVTTHNIVYMCLATFIAGPGAHVTHGPQTICAWLTVWGYGSLQWRRRDGRSLLISAQFRMQTQGGCQHSGGLFLFPFSSSLSL